MSSDVPQHQRRSLKRSLTSAITANARDDLESSSDSSSSSSSSSSASLGHSGTSDSRKRRRLSPPTTEASDDLLTGGAAKRCTSNGLVAPQVMTSMFNTVAHLASKMNAMEGHVAKLERENAALREAMDVGHPRHAQSRLWYGLKSELMGVYAQSSELQEAVTEQTRQTAYEIAKDTAETYVNRSLHDKAERYVRDEMEAAIGHKMRSTVADLMTGELESQADAAIEKKAEEWESHLRAIQDDISLNVQERVSAGVNDYIEDKVKYAVIDALANLEDRIETINQAAEANEI